MSCIPKFTSIINFFHSPQQSSISATTGCFILTTLVVGTIIYTYPGKVKTGCFKCANYLADRYLDFKYRNYKAPIVDKSVYKITKIQIVSMKNMGVCHELSIHDFLETNTFDNDAKIILDCRLIKEYVNYFDFDDQTFIYVHFCYGDQNYIIPIKYDDNKKINLPIYTINDIESCMKIEHDTIETKYRVNVPISDEHKQLIEKFAGPKGNFYCDTEHEITPEQIICDKTIHHLISSDNDDYLRLVSMLSDQVFTRNQPIKIEF